MTPILTAASAAHCLRLPVVAGLSVRDLLDATALRVRAACGGSGACGACLVRQIGGSANPFTLAEYQKLTPEQREAGVRLACQVRPQGDLEVALDDPAPPSPWRSVAAADLVPLTGALPELHSHIYGVAVDLGTTHIRVALWNRKQGQRIATRVGPNPQGVFGADLLNRLAAAHATPQRAAELAKLARSAIVQAVRDILARDLGEVRPMLAQIGELLVVGNSAMLALLTGEGLAALLDPDSWAEAVAYQPSDPEGWRSRWSMPHAKILLPASLFGFVGADLLANLLATGLTQGPPGSLLLDVGTNTEIALWDGRRLWVTSVPGGPAFEAVGIRHGMPAEAGAIYRVRAGGGQGGLQLETIGEQPARGFCGSGLIDAVALLLERGVLKRSGRFAQPPGPEGYRLDPENPRSALTGGDVDALQRAKAATAAAMAELLQRAGLQWGELRRLCLCGAFGHTLTIAHAQALGLLPPIARQRIELRADSSLTGCEMALLSGEGLQRLAQAGERLEAINLATCPGHEERFIDHLLLRAIR